MIAVVLSVVILLLAVVSIAPRVIDTPMVKAKLRGEIKEASGAEIDFEHLVLDFLPHPRITFKQATVSVPSAVKGQIASMTVRPKILPLFVGDVQIAGLHLQSAKLDYILPKKSAASEKTPQPFSYSNLAKRIQFTIASLPEFKIPDLDFRIRNSSANLFAGDRKFLELTEFNSHLEGPPTGRQISISCKSNFWQHISMSGLLDAQTFKGRGQIQMTDFRPQGLVADLFPNSPIRITEAPANLTIDFKTDGPGQLQAGLNGSSPHLKFRYAEDELNLKNVRIAAAFLVNQDSVNLSLTELALDGPQLNLSADLALTQNTPPLSLQAKGRRIDVAATRQLVLSLAGENEDVKDIFDVVKGGRVPLITLTAQGDSLSDLGDRDVMVIRGQMQDGEIEIPDIRFDLQEAAGDVVIARGILEGENLTARLGNSVGQNGRLKLGLIGDAAPFHLETDVRADLEQLPPILKRLVDDQDFQKELAQITDLRGSAIGKLVLGEDTDNVKVKVAASDIQLSGQYGRLPHPLQITGGNFTYDENRVGVSQLSGKLGKSAFSALSGSLGLDSKKDLALASGQATLHLAEIVPWLASVEEMAAASKYYGGGKSIVTLSQVKLNGPLFSPAKWHFNLSGDVEDLLLKNMPGRPGPLKVASARFKADPKTFNYTKGDISMLDGVWNISGTHKNYFKGFDKNVRLKFNARLGAKSVQWLSQSFDLPDEIHIRPLTLSNSRINYVSNVEKTISAELAIKGGLKISTDLVLGADQLDLKKLFIRDNASQATIGLSRRNNLLTFSFKGNLNQTTLDPVLTENPWLTGSIKGDFKAHIDMNHLPASAVWGELKGKGLAYPLKPDTPLTINDLALTASTHKINLQSADVNLGGNQLKAAGTITRTARNALLDMDIRADSLDLDQMIHALSDNGSQTRGEKAPGSRAFPIQGKIRLKADQFKIGRFSWQPLHADIRLKNDTADITLQKAALCGITTPGTLTISPPNIEFDIAAEAKDLKLDPARACLAGETFKADGTFNLNGRFQGRGKAGDLLKTSTGQVTFTAADGHIYHDVVMLEVLKFLNTINVFDGQANVKDMNKKGFDYHSFRVKAKL